MVKPEYKTIQVKALYSPCGEPTCRTENELCLFYRTTRWGSVEICNYTDKQIERTEDSTGAKGMGYTVVTEGCPLHEIKE